MVAPGAPVEHITPEVAQRTGLPASCIVCGGTTDSIAAFLAAGVTEPGEVRPASRQEARLAAACARVLLVLASWQQC